MSESTQRPDPKDASVIPPGPYCYTPDGVETRSDGTPVFKVKPCPHWHLLPGKPYQSNGYCAFLGLGDWDEVDYSTEPPSTRKGTGLLWDQVKECGQNDSDDCYEPQSNPSHGL